MTQQMEKLQNFINIGAKIIHVAQLALSSAQSNM